MKRAGHPDRIALQGARRLAETLIERLPGVALPIDPFSIAASKKISVVEKSVSGGFSGCLMKVGDEFAIIYSSALKNEGFINFSVSHELGHYFLPEHPMALFPNGDGQHFSNSSFSSDDRYEREADHFAVGLLMPTKLFLPALRRAGDGFAAIQKLSQLCRTSLTSTAIRYAEIAEDPVVVVVSSNNQVEFACLSDSIKSLRGLTWLRRGDRIPTRTATHALGSEPKRVRSAGSAAAWTSLDDWFDGAPQLEMKEDAVGLGGYGKVLTVLFTDEAIEDEEETEDDRA